MHQNPQQPRQAATEWYAVAADGASALRITPGFTLGETESGSLALNDPSPDRQWLEFHLDADGLRVEIIAPDLALVDAEGSIHRERPLDDGTRLALPHHTLQMSHDIRLSARSGRLFELIDYSRTRAPILEDELADDEWIQKEPISDEPTEDELADEELTDHQRVGNEYDLAESPGSEAAADEYAEGDEREADAESPSDPAEPASRGPAVLEVVADLRAQLGISGPGGRSASAHGPRADAAATRVRDQEPAMLDPDAIRRAFEHPEPPTRRIAEPPPARGPMGPPPARSVAPPQREFPDPVQEPSGHRAYGRRRPAARFRMGPLLLVAAVMVLAAAIVLQGPEWLDALEDQPILTRTEETAVQPDTTPGEPVAADPEPPSDSWSSAPDELDVRAAGPGSDAATGDEAAGSEVTAAPAAEPATPASQPEPGNSTFDPMPDDAEPGSAPFTPGTPGNAIQPGVAGTATTSEPQRAVPPPDAASDTGSAPRAASSAATSSAGVYAGQLALARNLMEEGEITTPPGTNAVAVLNGILERAPEQQEARALMAECGDKLVAAAVSYQQSGLEYQARNTLEEVLSFAPDHAEANRLWRAWVTHTP